MEREPITHLRDVVKRILNNERNGERRKVSIAVVFG